MTHWRRTVVRRAAVNRHLAIADLSAAIRAGMFRSLFPDHLGVGQRWSQERQQTVT